jgi:hypothetical protein
MGDLLGLATFTLEPKSVVKKLFDNPIC